MSFALLLSTFLATVLVSALACESEPDPLDFPPVECGEMTCDKGSICVKPGESCDYDLSPPDWVQPPFECAAPPKSCTDLTGSALDECLWETLCESSGEYSGSIFVDGTLDCPSNGLDCFE